MVHNFSMRYPMVYYETLSSLWVMMRYPHGSPDDGGGGCVVAMMCPRCPKSSHDARKCRKGRQGAKVADKEQIKVRAGTSFLH